MKKIITGIVLILAVILVWNLVSGKFLSKPRKIYINNQALNIEISDKEKERNKGLSGRANLAVDKGMLFIFPTANIYSFWMKDMQFPLDFIWINKEKIVDITENVPYPPADLPDDQLPTYSSRFPVDKVLEVNSGTVKSLGIKVGDIIHL